MKKLLCIFLLISNYGVSQTIEQLLDIKNYKDETDRAIFFDENGFKPIIWNEKGYRYNSQGFTNSSRGITIGFKIEANNNCAMVIIGLSKKSDYDYIMRLIKLDPAAIAECKCQEGIDVKNKTFRYHFKQNNRNSQADLYIKGIKEYPYTGFTEKYLFEILIDI
jgi:hypothetical protein